MAELVKLFVWVPADLRAAIKVEAARSRISMRAAIVEALECWVDAQKPFKAAPVSLDTPDARD